jgi:hypothetical protein
MVLGGVDLRAGEPTSNGDETASGRMRPDRLDPGSDAAECRVQGLLGSGGDIHGDGFADLLIAEAYG